MTKKVYSFISPKGGSGKTVLCASFGAFLATLGKKVLIIDADAATHGLTLLYLSEVNSHRKEMLSSDNRNLPPNGIYDAESEPKEEDLISLHNGVFLLPATYTFVLKEATARDNLRERIKNLLDNIGEQFDYVLIDAQAGSGNYVHAVVSQDISDEVIIISEYDPLSAAGVERLKVKFGNDLLFSRTWVLLNKMLPEFIESFSDFLEVSRYLPPIPWDSDGVRAYARRSLPLDINYGNPYTLAIIQTMKRLFGPQLALEIDQWTEDQATRIREPIEEQYRDAELELEALLNRQFELRSTKKQWRTRKIFLITFLITNLSVVLLLLVTSRILDITSSNSDFFIGSSLLLLLTGLLYLLLTRRNNIESSQKIVEEVRLQRQLDLVEERLKKLEALKKANLETLVKEGVKRR